MLTLITLEWKKHRAGIALRNAILLCAVLGLFLFALCYLGIANDPETGVPDAAPGNNTISAPIELFTGMAYLIFPSAMLASYVVAPCRDGTMGLLFTYPISRRKLVMAQLLAVWIFSFAALAATKLAIYGVIRLAAPYLEASFPLDYSMASPGFYCQLLLKSAVTVTLSFLALFVGLVLRSSRATLLTAFLLIILTQGSVGNWTLSQSALVPVVLAVLSLLCALWCVLRLERMDIN